MHPWAGSQGWGMQHPAHPVGCRGHGNNGPKPKGKGHVGNWCWEGNITAATRDASALLRQARVREHPTRSRQHPACSREPGTIAAACPRFQLPKQTPSLATTEQSTSQKQTTSGKGKASWSGGGGGGGGGCGEGAGTRPCVKDEGMSVKKRKTMVKKVKISSPGMLKN